MILISVYEPFINMENYSLYQLHRLFRPNILKSGIQCTKILKLAPVTLSWWKLFSSGVVVTLLLLRTLWYGLTSQLLQLLELLC